MNSKLPAFVFYYQPTCAHCKNMKDEWLKLAETMGNKVNLLAINGEEDVKLPYVGEVTYYPSLFLYQTPLKIVEMNPEKSLTQAETFEFNHSGLLKFLNKNGIS